MKGCEQTHVRIVEKPKVHLIYHSRLGASSADRWMACPASVRLQEGLSDTQSEHAAEGTAAHAYAEHCIREDRTPLPGEHFAYDDHGVRKKIAIPKDMAEAVKVYVDFAAEVKRQGYLVFIERKFELSKLHSAMFGTADFAAFNPANGHLMVMDYKHGSGKFVPVETSQTKFYGLGAKHDLEAEGHVIKSITLGIIQPRYDCADGPIRMLEITPDELEAWGLELKRAAYATDQIDSPAVAGEHCKWCKAERTPGRCPAQEDVRKKALRLAFAPDTPYKVEDLESALDMVPILEAWCAATREFAYTEAESGRAKLTRFKLVEKRATRKWKDEATTRGQLEMLTDLTPAQMHAEPKLLTVAQMEKLLPKDQKTILEALTVKEPSGHSLVSVDDPRPAVKLAAKDVFEKIPKFGEKLHENMVVTAAKQLVEEAIKNGMEFLD